MTYFRFRYPNKRIIPLNTKRKQALDGLKKDIESGQIVFLPNKCPCQSTNDLTLSEVDQYGLYLRYVICRECGIIRANPYMDEQSAKLFYKKYYEILYHSSFNYSGPEFDSEFEQNYEYSKTYIFPFSEIGTGKKILMIGGRSGGRLYPFIEANNDCTLIDLDTDSIKYAKSKGINAVCEDYKKINHDKLFDLIICDHVFEHFLDTKKELESLSQLLSIKGQLMIAVPDSFKLHSIQNLANSRLEFKLCHSYLFSKTTLINLLYEFGFSLIKSSHLSHPMNLVIIFEKTGIPINSKRKKTKRDKKTYLLQILALVKADLFYGFYRLIHFGSLKEKLAPRLRNNRTISKLYTILFK